MGETQLTLNLPSDLLANTSLPEAPTAGSVYAQGQVRGYRVQDLPKTEQPLHKLLEHGVKNRSLAELITPFIRGTKGGASPTEVASALLAHLETQFPEGALKALRDITAEELQAVEGIGPSTAVAILAAVELGKRVYAPTPDTKEAIGDPGKAADILAQDLMWEPKEKFGVLLLNVRHKLIAKKVISVGSATETLAHPREVFQAAIKRGAARMIVAHNHPSGSLEPSPDDLNLTRQLIAGGKLLGIPVLDHLILSNGSYRSLRQSTLLWSEAEA